MQINYGGAGGVFANQPFPGAPASFGPMIRAMLLSAGRHLSALALASILRRSGKFKRQMSRKAFPISLLALAARAGGLSAIRTMTKITAGVFRSIPRFICLEHP